MNVFTQAQRASFLRMLAIGMMCLTALWMITSRSPSAAQGAPAASQTIQNFKRIGDFVVDPAQIVFFQVWPNVDRVTIVFKQISGTSAHYITIEKNDAVRLRDWLKANVKSELVETAD